MGSLKNQSFGNGLSRKIPTLRSLPPPTSSRGDCSSISKHQGKVESVFTTINKLAKRKLSFGAKSEKAFNMFFSVREEEELVKASKCCLFTTAGPISGRMFISTDKLAFCSDKPIAKLGPSGKSLTFHYKVVIPLRKIKRANQTETVKKPSQKYIQVVTTDDFDFWFMGFLNCNKTLRCLQETAFM